MEKIRLRFIFFKKIIKKKIIKVHYISFLRSAPVYWVYIRKQRGGCERLNNQLGTVSLSLVETPCPSWRNNLGAMILVDVGWFQMKKNSLNCPANKCVNQSSFR